MQSLEIIVPLLEDIVAAGGSALAVLAAILIFGMAATALYYSYVIQRNQIKEYGSRISDLENAVESVTKELKICEKSRSGLLVTNATLRSENGQLKAQVNLLQKRLHGRNA